MADNATTPRAEDLWSVGTRVSWAAILAGAVVALALQFLLTVLGAAVGVAIGDRVEGATLGVSAIVWAIVTTCAALFVGGMVTSQFTVGENKVEAVLYGLIMWAVLLGFLLALGAAGARVGWVAMVGMADPATAQTWETAARNAGVPPEQVEEWRRKLAGGDSKQTPQASQTTAEQAKAVAWYVFGGIWISMLAAAAGAFLGAGPTFRFVAVGRGP